MAIFNRSISVMLVTVADNKDPAELKKELGEHGEVIGKVYSEGNKLKGGAFLWKHDKTLFPDDFYLIIISGRTSLTEATTGGEGIGGLSERGLFDLRKFHEDYPGIPMKKLDVKIDASDIPKLTDMRQLLTGREKGDGKKRKELQKDMAAISKQTGGRTRELNIGALIIENDNDFKRLIDELKPHTGEKELWAGRYPKMDIGLIIWHHKQPGKDDYWILLVLDKDSIIEGKLVDVHAPAINKFKKEYGNDIPIHTISVIASKKIGALDAGKIINAFEKRLKEIKG